MANEYFQVAGRLPLVQIQADQSGKIWINVSNNDPRLARDGVIARIRPEYNHTHFANVHGIVIKDKNNVYTF